MENKKIEKAIDTVLQLTFAYTRGKQFTVPGWILESDEDCVISFPTDKDPYNAASGLIYYTNESAHVQKSMWLGDFIKLTDYVPDVHYALRAGFIKFKRHALSSTSGFSFEEIEEVRKKLSLGFDEAMGLETIKAHSHHHSEE